MSPSVRGITKWFFGLGLICEGANGVGHYRPRNERPQHAVKMRGEHADVGVKRSSRRSNLNLNSQANPKIHLGGWRTKPP
jgi:hypothetical protein